MHLPLVCSRRRVRGFTLIELLTVIAIIGILAAIIIPTVGKVRDKAHRTADASNLRQITQACLIHANDNKGRVPSIAIYPSGVNFGRDLPTNTLVSFSPDLFAAALAVSTGLNEAKLWVSAADQLAPNLVSGPVLNATRTGMDAAFPPLALSVGVIGGLELDKDTARTPLVWTRGLGFDGVWIPDQGLYRAEGGFIAFLGGDVRYYQNLGPNATGELIASDGTRTHDIFTTVKTGRRVRYQGELPTGGPALLVAPRGP